MGQAKQRATALTAWQNSLSADERIVASVSGTVYERFVKALEATGMCYRISFFLTEYLANQHAIHVDPIVGFVNDGESEAMASHAWVEFGGKKIDLGLTLTKDSDAQPSGPLLILDRQFTAGRAIYTYHYQRNANAERQIQILLQKPKFDIRYKEIIRIKELEHEAMQRIARNKELIRDFLDTAPDGFSYEAIKQLVMAR